ncbi:MAG: hypothetical protein ACXVNO_02825 [Bacteroidia bacterium]
MHIKRHCIIFACVFGLFSCKHPVSFKDFPEVSYGKDIQPIIIANCTQSGCHGTKEFERFKLTGYDDLMKYTRIEAGNPENSRLYEVITTYNAEDLMPPKPYAHLSDKQVELIYVWIGQGAKNN